MTKLLWHSNAPWAPTGYGQQTGLFLPALKHHYPDIACSSYYGLEGAPQKWNDITVFPGIGGTYGDQQLVEHATQYFGGDPKAGLTVTLMDVWVLNPQWMSQLNTVSWVPVDHDPAPPRVVDFFVNSGAVPIAMSRFGQQMLGRLDPLYVPHGVDTDVYRPRDVSKVREKVFGKDAFVVGMVAANKGRPSRKGFSQAFQAFRKLLEHHENAYLYLHTTLDPMFGEGENLAGLIRELGIPWERIKAADQYAMTLCPHTHDDMATLYSTLDVLLNPAMGEGFGIPIVEAQACGTPVIVTDFSAMKEISSPNAWRVKHTPWWTGQNSWQAMPDVDDIASALVECCEMPSDQRDLLAKEAREHALGYSLPRVMDEFMVPALKTAEKRFSSQNPVTIAPRLKTAA